MKSTTYPKFEMVTGKPDTANVELFKFTTQPIEEELFPHEQEALNIVKQTPISKFFNDRFIMGCLFSRKLDIQRTIKMLKSNLKWRLANHYEKIPRWQDIDKTCLSMQFACLIPGARSKDGNAILYCKLSRLVPSEMGKNYLKTIIDYVIWNNCCGTFLDGIDFHRNGLIFVADLEGVGWKNIDISLQRKMNSALMDNFPLRIQKVFILNPPSIIQAIMGVVRVFIKKKIMDRIQIIQKEELVNYIDPDNLWSEFGGNLDYSVENLVQAIDEYNDNHPRLHTITKNKNKKISQSSTANLNPSTDKNKKKRNVKGKNPTENSVTSDKENNNEEINNNSNIDLGDVLVDGVPEKVIEDLKKTHGVYTEISDEETNSFLDKIDETRSEDSARSPNPSKKKGNNNENSDVKN